MNRSSKCIRQNNDVLDIKDLAVYVTHMQDAEILANTIGTQQSFQFTSQLDYQSSEAAQKGSVSATRSFNVQPEELKAVLVHEFAHIYYKDSIKSSLMIGANIVGNLMFSMGRILLKFLDFLVLTFNGIPVISLFCFFLGLISRAIVLLLNGLDRVMLLIVQFGIRQAEYRADQFVVELGYGDSLAKFLEKVADISVHEDGFWRKYTETHPAPMKRVGRIEQAMW